MKTRQNNKAQVSLEYLIITSLLLLILIAMGIVLYQKYSEWADLRTHLAERTATNTIAETINQVVSSGDGYWQTFTVYSRYTGDEFNITFKRSEPAVFIETEDMTMHAPLLTANVTCCLPQCTSDGERTTLYLNAALSSKVINRRNQIYIGQTC